MNATENATGDRLSVESAGDYKRPERRFDGHRTQGRGPAFLSKGSIETPLYLLNRSNLNGLMVLPPYI